jgi:hypothetical protein
MRDGAADIYANLRTTQKKLSDANIEP